MNIWKGYYLRKLTLTNTKKKGYYLKKFTLKSIWKGS